MRNTMTRDERHSYILKTARDLFMTNGYDDVSISDVIKASDIARGTFYLHFESMESLLIAVFDDVIEEMWGRIGPILEQVEDIEDCTKQTVHAVLTMFHHGTNPLAEVFFSGGGAAFLKWREQAMYSKFGQLVERALAKRHGISLDNAEQNDDERRLHWTVVMLITLVANMTHYATRFVAQQDNAEFEQQLVQFVLAGIRTTVPSNL